MDNFKQLLWDGEGGFKGREERVYKRVSGTLDTFRLFGEIVDMYFPKMVDTLIVIAGGEDEEGSPREAATDADAAPTGPGGK